ncbi:MAG TPA: hypothetical protein DEF47_10030 [Herpetosiphon sp.]|uniref:Uncharacterized protein n=1 Tax=Herpetosiphon aurantiacus (strain ATCC 23779 / DSM 785 / 114-95) TaxID=316274 RepID=A9AUX5_HERA2|nr:hypothetical protein [Herpetosiphon sp.]ABX06563.1 hypothetical protein Haur_3929 [Herpetosiphon aurantiacus DSM 785]HBW50231.1 hypothetical protein [Herpetosiphon sp.]
MSNSPKRRSSLMLNTSMSVAAIAATLTGWAVLSNQQAVDFSAELATPEPIVAVAEVPQVELPVLPTVAPLTRNGHRIIRIPNDSAGGSTQPSAPNQSVPSAPATGGGSSNVPSQAAPQPAAPRQVAPVPTAVPAPAPAAPAAPSRNTRSSR